MIKISKNVSAVFLWSILYGLWCGVLYSGCGYATKSTLPANLKTIHVEPFKNSIDFTTGTQRDIYLPLLEVKSRNAVIDRFVFDGSLKIAEAPLADLILKGELVGYDRTALRYTDNNDVEEYRVQVSVSFGLLNTKTGETSWKEPGFTGTADYFISGPQVTTEDSAIDEAILDLARRIVERTVEDW
jgi:hypothetical protein